MNGVGAPAPAFQRARDEAPGGQKDQCVCVCVCVCDEMLFSHKKEGNSAIQDNMDLEGVMLSEIRHIKTNTV